MKGEELENVFQSIYVLLVNKSIFNCCLFSIRGNNPKTFWQGNPKSETFSFGNYLRPPHERTVKWPEKGSEVFSYGHFSFYQV